VGIYFAGQRVAEMERIQGEGKARIDYRHVIGSLVRKPGAFERYRYREQMFRSTVFRQAYDQLQKEDAVRASRRYLEILEWAAMNSECSMERALRELLDAGAELDFQRLRQMSERPVESPPLEISIPLPDMRAKNPLRSDHRSWTGARSQPAAASQVALR